MNTVTQIQMARELTKAGHSADEIAERCAAKWNNRILSTVEVLSTFGISAGKGAAEMSGLRAFQDFWKQQSRFVKRCVLGGIVPGVFWFLGWVGFHLYIRLNWSDVNLTSTTVKFLWIWALSLPVVLTVIWIAYYIYFVIASEEGYVAIYYVLGIAVGLLIVFGLVMWFLAANDAGAWMLHTPANAIVEAKWSESTDAKTVVSLCNASTRDDGSFADRTLWHRVIVVNDRDGSLHEAYHQVPEDRQADRLDQADVVFCVSPVLSDHEETCEYTNDTKVELYERYVVVQIVARESKTAVTSFDVDGEELECDESRTGNTDVTAYGAPPSAADISDEINAMINHGSVSTEGSHPVAAIAAQGVTTAPTTTAVAQGVESDGMTNSDWTPVIQEFDGVEMVLVPAGCFEMGSGGYNEQPVHEVCLSAFWIGKTEVSNAQYRMCVAAGGCTEPKDTRYYADEVYVDHPVVYVDWNQARAYCDWAGGALPTEAQWEYAARGPEAWTYPWGEAEPTCDVVNMFGCEGGIVPVGSYPDGASWVGALDMSGNVWEWAADWYYSDYYGTLPVGVVDPQGPETGSARVLRGGSWRSDSNVVRAPNRINRDPNESSIIVGFRCARSAFN